jgi:alkylation response protein AidB-like acyl-CoA dehydrogenase
MDLNPTDEQQQLIDAFGALYAKSSSPETVRAAEPLGFDQRLWEQLLETGVLAMAVDEAHGGWGASLLDLELVAEQHGRAVAPAPLIEAQVAARLLARLDDPAAADALAAALDGTSLVTVGLTPARDGRALMVPAGAVADVVVVRRDGDLVVARIGDDRVVPENLGSMPLADVDVSGGRVVATGDVAAMVFESALDDWLTLSAGALVGIAARSLEIGVEYVKERSAFGQQIGGFQAVAHRLADSAAAIDGAELIAREAAWAEAEDPERFGELAAMAFAFAGETARDASYRALHFHGGYGFMLEYDIQLYHRRARAWAVVGMDSRTAYRRVADHRERRVAR